MRTWRPGCAATSEVLAKNSRKVFREARLIWCDLIPRSRASGKDRFGNFMRGLKRKANNLDNSEQGFLRKRRAAAAAATSSRSSGDIYASAVAAGAATWSKDNQTCEDKWELKREATKYSGEHTMLPEDDVDPEVLRAARIARAKAAATAEKARAKQKFLKRVFNKKGNGHSTACLSIFVNRSVVNPGAAANR